MALEDIFGGVRKLGLLAWLFPVLSGAEKPRVWICAFDFSSSHVCPAVGFLLMTVALAT